MNEVIERRLEYLKLEANGLSLCEIVKTLSEKWQKTERTIYNDAETRETWQPLLTQLFEMDKARLMIVNRYEFLYKEAAFKYRHANEAQQPVWWDRMLAATDRIVSLQGIEPIAVTEKNRELNRIVDSQMGMLGKLLEVKV